MAYRRKQGAPGSSSAPTDEFGSHHFRTPPPLPDDSSSSSTASSLAAKAIRASSAYRDSSLSSAYGHSGFSPSRNTPSVPTDSGNSEYVPPKSSNEPRHGFWGVLASKAKSILEDENVRQQFETSERTKQQTPNTAPRSQYESRDYSHDSNPKKMDNPALQKGLGAITSSLSYIGGTIGNALEEGLNIVENRTAEIIQETRKLQLRRKDSSSKKQNDIPNAGVTRQKLMMQTHVQPQIETALETQLKASRDVAMAMAAKAKLLLRELKTFKADLAFAKERCAQLEEENRIFRESLEKGDNPEDDDLIRLQLETLLAEKARLAQENSVFARENRFLREIVEYHQLTMQDVVYFDEGNEEVTEVYPIIPPPPVNIHVSSDKAAEISNQSSRIHLARSSSQISQQDIMCPVPVAPSGISQTITPLSSFIDITTEEDLRRH